LPDGAVAIEITGAASRLLPVEPWNVASPKLNTPPSGEQPVTMTAHVAAIEMIGLLRRRPPVEPK
jgi:hypothetical protein